MDRIGKYVIHKAAVTTGYGRVFFCHDPDLQIPVAVKVLAPPRDDGPMSAAQLRTRFEVEARALAAFDHPHIVPVKTMEHTVDGRPFFVMPYLAAHLEFEIGKDEAGEGAADHDKPRRVPLARALALLKQLSAALTTMHRRGYVHRFVKPSNILLTARENGQAKLADFSMVKLPERNAPLPDQWLGCTRYCAPEQRENATGVGPEADVYSLGVLTYRLLTGTLPDPAAGPAEMPPRTTPVIAKLVAEATDPDPARRPAHAGVFLQALAAVPPEALAKPKVQVLPIRRPMAKRPEPAPAG
ncbi:serine/threonine-protein kinase [Magnetospirillum sp. UT-4]|uniref:serine/threonine-protein kinase n=1 Tax=Magnetospirillum sp. UT-4 TaxID=2681467 RepID=UPI00137DE43B|nr:serine/threonine-protein kinase [Magnetospirillum sp. UT-4]CAA7623227.1 putative serine/threonine-protein kinase pknL [Magnetospirillum sp. UT-4]